MIHRFRSKAEQVARLVREGPRGEAAESMRPFRRAGLGIVHRLYRSAEGFHKDECMLRASAMTFYTLLSIVPVIAMAFGIAKGFGLQKTLEVRLLENFPGQEDVFSRLFTFANTLLDNTRGGLLAGIGVVVLLWTVIKLLGNIEASFNAIWKVPRPRTIWRKFSDYLSLMLVAPILFVLSGSLNVFVTTQIRTILDKLPLLGAVGPYILFTLKFLPYLIFWILFTILYSLMPNRKVSLPAAFAGGILGGTLYQLTQWVYVHFQVGVAKYNAIYGSFAALPLFLVWLQLGWMIVLWGAEMSRVFEEGRGPLPEDFPDRDMSFRVRALLSLGTAASVVRAFHRGDPAPTAAGLSRELALPESLVEVLLGDLTAGGILVRVEREGEGAPGWHPARNVATITVQSVLEAASASGTDDLPGLEDAPWKPAAEKLSEFREILNAAPANRPVGDL
ncbi:MAG TPA: YihY/virulence factor BrkB family protein [Syntrophales bacterium]|nr:YihY/virulence factor BrkB family protein [Syntrophales bacterium]HQN77352.1 YihY/virulence factor BrkB family protein [Syntrophales bacterium]HQQ26340.1 YihY/virulence factor BrkB family protein [Syntrophales bacterium]